MKLQSFALWALAASFQCCLLAFPSFASGIGDIPAEILNLLLSPGIQITHIDITLSVLSLLLNMAALDFDGKTLSPLPLVELTIDGISAEIGTEGTTFFSFNHTFPNFVLPGLSSANSGVINNVALTQGGVATLSVISNTEFDILSATYNIRVLTVNGTGGIPLTLPAAELAVPTKLDFQCP